MDAIIFKEMQDDIGWTNRRLAQFMQKSEQTISNYRAGRQGIPPHVGPLLQAAKEISVAELVRRAPPEEENAREPSETRESD